VHLCSIFSPPPDGATTKNQISNRGFSDFLRTYYRDFLNNVYRFSCANGQRVLGLAGVAILSVNWRHIHWPSFGKGENTGSVLLWYSCFDRSILMFLMREWLQCCISRLKHCLMRLWNDISKQTFVFSFAETRSIKRMWRKLTERMPRTPSRHCFWFLISVTPSKTFVRLAVISQETVTH